VTRREPGPKARDRSRAIQAARERDAAERRERRRRRLLVVAVTVAVLVLAVAIDVKVHQPNGRERALLAAAATDAKSAGCAGVTVVPPYPGGDDRTHVGSGSPFSVLPALSSYPSTPPASGPHDPVPLDAGVYATPPSLGAAIHSLEHSAVIVWYDPAAAPAPELTQIQRFFAEGGERNHVIVAPYSYPEEGAAGALPSGRTMALVAWHHLQLCDRPSLAVAYAFVHAYRFDLYQFRAYRGDAPEKYLPI